jgi:hypothetical protein
MQCFLSDRQAASLVVVDSICRRLRNTLMEVMKQPTLDPHSQRFYPKDAHFLFAVTISILKPAVLIYCPEISITPKPEV